MRHPFGPFSGRGGTAGQTAAGGEEKAQGSPGRGAAGTLSLLFSCAAVLYLLFHPYPSLTPSRALEITKNSRDLSPLLSNEEFINAYEDAANARETVGWLVDRTREGGFLVSYIYLDGKGDFKGWFFEVPAGSGEARRVTRSMGEHYVALIDDRFERSTPAVSERDRVTRWVKEAKALSGGGTVLEEISRELGRTGVRKDYGWMARPLGNGKWLVGFVYEPEGAGAGEKRGWVFHVNSRASSLLSGGGLPLGAGSVEDLLRFFGTPGDAPLPKVPVPADETDFIPLGVFMESTLTRFGGSPSEARLRFGEPGAVRRRNVAQPSDPPGGRPVLSMMWPGLSLDFSGSSGAERLVSAAVKTGSHPFGPDPGIRVGDLFSRVSDLLGEPSDRNSRSVVYSGRDVPFCLVFDLRKDGRIAGMSFSVPAE
jgi:hypothetical protein